MLIIFAKIECIYYSSTCIIINIIMKLKYLNIYLYFRESYVFIVNFTLEYYYKFKEKIGFKVLKSIKKF